jgi:hypothetical protein
MNRAFFIFKTTANIKVAIVGHRKKQKNYISKSPELSVTSPMTDNQIKEERKKVWEKKKKRDHKIKVGGNHLRMKDETTAISYTLFKNHSDVRAVKTFFRVSLWPEANHHVSLSCVCVHTPRIGCEVVGCCCVDVWELYELRSGWSFWWTWTQKIEWCANNFDAQSFHFLSRLSERGKQ